jgi:PBP1b-binding outer membrane lipoprotein LpoB
MAINFKRLYADLMIEQPDIDDKYSDALAKLREKLQDPELRLKLRMMLPSIISKINFDTIRNEFEIFDVSGKPLYKSLPS